MRAEPLTEDTATDTSAPAASSAGGGIASRLEHFAQLALVLLLVVGCWRVLAPFFPAILFAMVIAVSTWPVYTRLLRALHGRVFVSSLLASLLAMLVAVGPVVLVLMSLADSAAGFLHFVEDSVARGAPAAPGWLRELPLLGAPLFTWWNDVAADPARLKELLSLLAAPARQAALVSGRALGNAAMQIGLTALLLYFLYREGERLGLRLQEAARRIGGGFAQELIDTARHSVIGVMFGEIGAGFAQATVATIGFLIADVPNPFLLGTLTFVLSMVPIGPPLIWGGAALWLFQQGDAAWGLFMIVYGLLGISTIDNVLKPLLISRANHLPFVLTLMGVVGGVLSFGVMGVFLGPTLLALSIDLAAHWLRRGSGGGKAATDTDAA